MTGTNRVLRSLLKVAAVFALLIVLIGAAALFTLQTDWFKEKVREHVIAGVESATGGRIELGGFSYNWQNLTADFEDFVIHGSEPAAAPPLFRASSVRVQLRIISAFERKIAVSSVIVERPNIYILVRADGSTNIPSPRVAQGTPEPAVQEILNLKLRHFELQHGNFQSDLQRIPLNLRGSDISVLLTYNRPRASYLAKISSRDFRVNTESFQSPGMTVSAQARLERNRLVIESANLASGASTVRLSGAVKPFNRSAVNLSMDADLAVNDIARIAGISQLRGGRVQLRGDLHRDANSPFAFSGQIAAQQLAMQTNGYVLNNCDLAGQLVASPNGVALSSFKFRAPGAQLTGDASMLPNREFRVSAHVSEINLIQAEQIFLHTHIPWSGAVSGMVAIQGHLATPLRDVVVETRLDAAPSPFGTPISGHLEATYHESGDTLEFANSQINLPHTRIAFSGRVNENLQTVLDTTNFDDLRSVPQLSTTFSSPEMPKLLANGSAHFDGVITGRLQLPRLSGNMLLKNCTLLNTTWDRIGSYVDLSPSSATLTDFSADNTGMHASGSARVQLVNWRFDSNAPALLKLQFRVANISSFARFAFIRDIPVSGGPASGSLDLEGRLSNPQGTAQLKFQHVRAFDQRLDDAAVDLQLRDGAVEITNGRASSGAARLNFSGTYTHGASSWSDGEVQVRAETNAFPLTTLSLAREYEPGWDAQVELHGDAAFKIDGRRVEPTVANGKLVLRHVTENNEVLGDVTLDASTKGDVLYAGFSGDLRETHIKGNAQVHLVAGSPVKGQMQVDRIGLRTLYGFLYPNQVQALPLEGFARGSVTFEGPLAQVARMQAKIRVDELQISASALVQAAIASPAPDVLFHNSRPIVFDAANGQISVRDFQLTGPDTNIAVTGSVHYLHQASLDLKADGRLDLRVFQLFQPGVQTSGRSIISTSIIGSPSAPNLNGTLEVQNGTFFANGFPNGLTRVNGILRFDRDRATIQKLTAETGGGTLSASGFIGFGAGGPLVYRLEATADNVRVRYANSISITASSQLRVTGTSKSSVISGTATVSRVVFTPNADVGTLLAVASAPTASAANQRDFLTGLQLDIHIESSPDLQVTTQLSRDVQAEIDLRLRGTPEQPVLLGDIVANQGDIKVFGGKYTINRGEVRFVDAARIEPVLDLDLQTEARGIIVDITIAGTLGKLNINYRSDPPLQPRDIIALLTVGRAPDTAAINPNVQTSTDVSAMQYGANTVLGQAISPVSNRLSKLFGITNIKIDPLVQGITNVPQARLTLEQQISREITVTYVTNLSQTSEQIFRVEWSFSPQYSVVALRDDNGEFGIDIQYRKRFK